MESVRAVATWLGRSNDSSDGSVLWLIGDFVSLSQSETFSYSGVRMVLLIWSWKGENTVLPPVGCALKCHERVRSEIWSLHFLDG